MTDEFWAILDLQGPIPHDVHHEDSNGLTALFRAGSVMTTGEAEISNEKFLELFEALLADGANPNATNGKGLTSLWWAPTSVIPDLMPLLVRYGLDLDTLHADDGQSLMLDILESEDILGEILEAVRALLEAGHWPDPDTEWGEAVREHLSEDDNLFAFSDVADLLEKHDIEHERARLDQVLPEGQAARPRKSL
jgi:hypothetical protein